MPASRLWGAAERLREEVGTPVSVHEREEYSLRSAQAQALVGADAFDAAREAGRAMGWEQAVDYALGLRPF